MESHLGIRQRIKTLCHERIPGLRRETSWTTVSSSTGRLTQPASAAAASIYSWLRGFGCLQ
jgi:hypothetical protein